MNHFFVFNGRRIKRILILIVAVVFAVGIVYVEKDNITVFAPNEPSAIYSVQTDKKLIALTFDISWGNKRAGPILDVLEQKGVKNATFFLSSPWSKSHPDIVKRIVDSGYEVGSHGHKHDNYSRYSENDIRTQIQTAHDILTELTGKAPNLIRMPNGDFDKRVLRVANDLNYKVIQWDTDSLDWKNPGVDAIINRVVKRAHPGDIVLLHASDSCQQTHLALPVIIDQLRAKGYEFVTVSQLLNQTDISQKPAEQPGAAQIHA
ncbi:polysaccharide deacetylase family sporulation protein PdaB [Paenibacillus thermoaerophilus]|uniref:Polysaccharide deacetylase family sporulation protein PdaB n=1 Tax=Paenibacillus thermoaerophilus TaxID=1215385 RepID=A0ABW2V4S3_9BACL|nr:polysaccharide deacetylase family sporulation protein PdaB [Paenibacillus thermoaerophilus]TMV10931.1 polysaccharide deacetylase family sporulation protein PdaB [Paenibacillus thermoaerophilus]